MRRTPLISLLLLAIAPAAFAQTPDRYSIPGSTVAVYNLAGSVTIEPGTGANVVIEVQRGGPDADRLEVERMDVEGRPALVVRYPDDNVVYAGRNRGSTQIRVSSDGTFSDGIRGRRVTIRGSGRGMEAHADLRILVPADRSVAVRLGVGDVTANDIAGGLDIDVHSASVRTRGTNGRLRVDTGSGSVVVENAEGDEILVDTGSGSIEVNDIRASGVLLDTGSGSVRGTGLSAGQLGVDTGSGRIALANVTARDIVLDTGSGSVELDLASRVDRLRVDTGSGSVRLRVPADFGADLDIDSGSGGIKVDFPVTIARSGRTSLIGTIGDGQGRVEIDTGSGSISIVSR